MTTRLWTALLLLAGVFALHGLQCAAAGTDSAAGHVGHVGHVVAAPTGHAGQVGSAARAPEPAHAAAGVAAHEEQPRRQPTVVAVAAAVTGSGHGSGPHDAAGHLWTVCLAVLAAGLAVLCSLAAARLRRLAPPAAALSWLGSRSWLVPPRPPDLFSLCVLRA